MTHSIEIAGGRKVEHLIEIKETNGQDRFMLRTKKSVNQIFDEKLKDVDNTSIESTTIFNVNVGLRKSNPDAYTPMLISIGPYHKKNPQLGSMENYKLLYLHRFLKRKEGLDVESCIRQLEEMKDEALKCYDDLDNDIVGKFSEMLFIDGCFVIEYIRECNGMKPIEEDEIIDKGWMNFLLRRDMLLLENQLPYFVLAMLRDMTKHPGELDFIYMVKVTFFEVFPNKLREKIYGKAERPEHLLHAVHMLSCPSKRKSITRQTTNASTPKECLQIIWSKEKPKDSVWQCCQIPSATELYEAGVSFEKIGTMGEDPMDRTTLFDIKFKDGSIEIPCFAVEDTMEPFMRNMIAYEQHSSDIYPRYFTDYVWIMNQLIASHKDVNLLCQNGIILNEIGYDQQVASIFNKLTEGVITCNYDFYYNAECSKIIQHCVKPWNRMKANLKHNYFSSPWAGASTVAAITLLLLTAMQTVLTLISVLNNK